MIPDWLSKAERAHREAQVADVNDYVRLTQGELELVEKNAFDDDVPAGVASEALSLVNSVITVSRSNRLTVRARDIAVRLSSVVAAKEAAEAAAIAAAAEAKAKVEAQARAAAAARTAARVKEIVSLGAPRRRADLLARLPRGPFNVLLYDIKRDCDEDALRGELIGLGYLPSEIDQVLERVIHIEPEAVAYLLEQSEAVQIKMRFEAAGAKVRIKRRA